MIAPGTPVASVAASAALLLAAGLLSAQADPSPYQPAEFSPRLPNGAKFGAVSAVAADGDGNVLVLQRAEPPVLVFDAAGKLLRSFGAGMVKTGHGLRVDRDGNVWLTDIGNHVVIKFDKDGKALLALGTKGQPGNRSDSFNQPTDVAFAPTGEFYVSDGYGNSRVVKFSKDGKFLHEWGRRGKGEGEFHLPHAIVTDSKGRVYVGDRENNRVQVFDADGKFLAQWKESGAPFGLHLDGDARMLVADGRAHRVNILDAEGKLIGRFGTKGTGPGRFELPHMLTTDKSGAVYVAEVKGERVQKFVRR